MSTLLSLVAESIGIITKTSSVTSDDKVGIVTTFGFQHTGKMHWWKQSVGIVPGISFTNMVLLRLMHGLLITNIRRHMMSLIIDALISTVIYMKHLPHHWPFVREIHRSPVNGEFPPLRPVTQSFDVFCDLRLNKQLSKQSRRQLWRHCIELNHRWI